MCNTSVYCMQQSRMAESKNKGLAEVGEKVERHQHMLRKALALRGVPIPSGPNQSNHVGPLSTTWHTNTQLTIDLQPPFIFRIEEIGEHANSPVVVNNKGFWEPSTVPGANIRVGGGVSGIYWLCNGQSIQPLNQPLPATAALYSVFSMYYCAGLGFWVLRGDATNPEDDPWRPLLFDHDNQDYSSYLTNAGNAQTLRCQRPTQSWPRMLLPDIYQVPPTPTNQAYGGLKGELAILLALIAFSMSKEHLQMYLVSMFLGSVWQVHGLPHGRRSALTLVEIHTDGNRNPSAWRRGLRLHKPPRMASKLDQQRTAPLRGWTVYAFLQLMCQTVERR
jgi:hypothetical protein